MKGVRDWVFSQILSKSLASSRPLSGSDNFFSDAPRGEEVNEEGSARTAGLVANSVPPHVSHSSDTNQENHPALSVQQIRVEDSNQSHQFTDERRTDRLAKIEDLQIKLLRVVQRLGHSQDNLLIAKVLYRLHLATLIRTRETDMKRFNLRSDRSQKIAAEQEATGLPQLNFTFKILVLGKTGVGKSATINSLFDQTKAGTDAFQPATDSIQEVVGTVNGIKITVIDTPGLLPSSISNMKRNRKIIHSVKRFIRKSPPDLVLYFERLDLINMGYSDLPLLKLLTEVLGSGIWFNTILVMTHAAFVHSEGSNGYPVSYDSYVAQCTDLVQHYIHQAMSESKLENPVLLVENHPLCKKNMKGERILPNGHVWKSQFLLLCTCMKILADANNFLDFQDSIKLGPVSSIRVPSLPHLLSSLLRHRPISNPGEADNEMYDVSLSEKDEKYEYDQLPSIRILTKSQFERLTKTQKKEYLDELDFRETLYLMKQLKLESLRCSEKQLPKEENFANEDVSDNQDVPEAVVLPDMTLPHSFELDCPVHRYRCIITSERWLVRPVLDPQGWDHDVGFDGLSLETAMELKRNIVASVAGQLSKDKQNFSIQSECAATYTNPGGPTYSTGLDVHSSGKDMIYTVHSNTKLRNQKYNTTECGLSVTSFGNKYYVGAKLEDTILIGRRLKFAVNAGRMGSSEKAAYGGSFEATLRGSDYPARNDNVNLLMTVLSFDKEMVVSGTLQSEFRMSRSMKASVNANLNSQKLGQISVKVCSSEHIQIAVIGMLSIFKFMLRKKGTENISREELEGG